MHLVLMGDVDGDGVADFRDLLSVLAAWGMCDAGCCLADFGFRGAVDFTDLLSLLANWI